jgi:hypothetical protein
MFGLGVERAAHEHELGRWLRAAERLGVHARTGHASLYEYAERLLGLTRRQVEERLRVARALDDLPVLEEALASGKLGFSAVRELTRGHARDRAGLARLVEGPAGEEVEQAVADLHIRGSAARPGRSVARPPPAFVRGAGGDDGDVS